MAPLYPRKPPEKELYPKQAPSEERLFRIFTTLAAVALRKPPKNKPAHWGEADVALPPRRGGFAKAPWVFHRRTATLPRISPPRRMTTRRFCRFPSAVLLGATGRK